MAALVHHSHAGVAPPRPSVRKGSQTSATVRTSMSLFLGLRASTSTSPSSR